MINRLLNKYKNRKFKKLFPDIHLEGNVDFIGPLTNLIVEGRLTIKNNTIIHLGGFEWCAYLGSLEIGSNSIISYNCVIMAAGPGGIKIGNNVEVGPGVKIFSNTKDYDNKKDYIFKPVIIEDNVFLYANTVISPGVKIGKNSSIAAGSVVLSDIPPYSFAAGSPAKVIKKLSPPI